MDGVGKVMMELMGVGPNHLEIPAKLSLFNLNLITVTTAKQQDKLLKTQTETSCNRRSR